MESLFIDRKGAQLDVEAGRLLIRIPDAPRPTSLPLRQLRFIVVCASVGLSSRMLLALDNAGITLVVIHPRQNGQWVVCNGHRHGHVARRVAQYAWLQDDVLRLQAARRIVGAKILSQYRVLRRYRRQRPDLRHPLTQALRHLRARFRGLANAQDLDQLRGLEGAAAAVYFAALARLVAPHWGFRNRRRRPPPDPVNALLSLTYSLVHGEAVRALVGHGLDPAMGCLHELNYGRESLACDLVELLRASVDHWVLHLLRSERLRPCHFQQLAAGHCLLNKDGRAEFYAAYQDRLYDWRRYCRDQAAQWARLLGPLPDTDEPAPEVDDGPSLSDD